MHEYNVIAGLPANGLLPGANGAISMSQSTPRLTAGECAQRGREMYERNISTQLAEEQKGQVVAIDVASGAFEVAADALSAADRLNERCPGAQIWFARVGQGPLHRIGAGGRSE
jgi:hypothetical protein